MYVVLERHRNPARLAAAENQGSIVYSALRCARAHMVDDSLAPMSRKKHVGGGEGEKYP